MDLSIVIVSFNTREITRRCLETIFRQTDGLIYEVIVVDNASSDGSTDMIRREFPTVKMIANDRNLGFAAAQNVGVIASSGRILLILNSDVFFVGNAAKEMFDYLTAQPRVGVVGPQILNPGGTVAPSARRAVLSAPMVALSILNRHFGLKNYLPSETFLRRYLGGLLGRWHDNYAPHAAQREAEWVDGMCVMVKREVLEEVGLFDEQFFLDCEIIDLCNRIRARGWQIAFFPGAQVVHQAHSSRAKFSRAVVEKSRSELIYYAKYAPAHAVFMQRLGVWTALAAAWLLKLRLLLTGPDDGLLDRLQSCRQIISEYRSFQPALAKRNERIPRLHDPLRKSAFLSD